MQLNIHEIEEAAKALDYEEPTESLSTVLQHGDVCDYEMNGPAAVHLEYYRAGRELFFQGDVRGVALGHCGRCLETYPCPYDTHFAVMLVPKAGGAVGEVELDRDELDVSTYEGDLVDLTPLVQEQIILALPTRPLCGEACKGLCPTCGINRNADTCHCAAPAADPRLAVLRQLKVAR